VADASDAISCEGGRGTLVYVAAVRTFEPGDHGGQRHSNPQKAACCRRLVKLEGLLLFQLHAQAAAQHALLIPVHQPLLQENAGPVHQATCRIHMAKSGQDDTSAANATAIGNTVECRTSCHLHKLSDGALRPTFRWQRSDSQSSGPKSFVGASTYRYGRKPCTKAHTLLPACCKVACSEERRHFHQQPCLLRSSIGL
jgi:hypothetical protein